jgi:hypothetical protein
VVGKKHVDDTIDKSMAKEKKILSVITKGVGKGSNPRKQQCVSIVNKKRGKETNTSEAALVAYATKKNRTLATQNTLASNQQCKKIRNKL